MKQIILSVALALLFLAGAPPALACPGPFAERYLIWPDRPPLLPGEVAIELDIDDVIKNLDTYDHQFPKFKIRAEAAETKSEAAIEVRRKPGGCELVMASGIASQLFLVGALTRNSQGELQLLPRYMRFDDPIRAKAYRTMLEIEDQN